MTPALTGPWWKRAAWSRLMIDESTAIRSAQTERCWGRDGYLCGGLAIFVTWNLATFIGATALCSSGELVTTWGIDVTIPAASLALLWPRLAEAGQRRSSPGRWAHRVSPGPVHPARDGPIRLSDDPDVARRLLALLPSVPTPTWGRDELQAGEMWSCNSIVSWAITAAGIDTEAIALPPNARAPGWDAGIAIARRARLDVRVDGAPELLAGVQP
jgi:hypothetical protein